MAAPDQRDIPSNYRLSSAGRPQMYVRFPLSLRNVEDLLFERGIDIYHEMARL